MDLVAKLPSLDDGALAVLRDNAERLEQSGTKTQRSAAAALLPAIETELASRREAKKAAASAKRAASSARRAAPKAAKTAKKKTKDAVASDGAAAETRVEGG